MAKSSLEKSLQEIEKLKAKGVISEEEYAERRAAIVSAAPAAEQRGGSGIGRVFKFGCLGIVGLFVVVAILGAVAAGSGGGDDDGDSADATPGAAGTNPGDVHVPLRAGSVGEIAPRRMGDRKLKITVLAIEDTVTPTSEFLTPPEGKRWWGMEVEVENVGTSEASTPSWKLRDANDGEIDRAFVVSAGESLDPLLNLTPGGKTRGWVYFEVPTGVAVKWVRADPNLFAENDLYFDQ